MDFTTTSDPQERASTDDLCILRFHQYCIRLAPPAAGLQLTACPPHEMGGLEANTSGGGVQAPLAVTRHCQDDITVTKVLP